MQAVVAEGEHAVEDAASKDALVAFNAEAIAGGIGELRIFLRTKAHLLVFLAGGECNDIILAAHQDHAGVSLRDDSRLALWWLFFRSPERMRFGKYQWQEGLEGPIGEPAEL